MDALMLGVGVAMLTTGLPAIVRPDKMVRESLRNRNRRLRELDAGAPEDHFAERRELEAYPPRFDLDERKIRVLGGLGSLLGAASIYQGLF